MKRHKVQIVLNFSFTVFVCLLMNSSASAGLVVDQQNDVFSDTTVGCSCTTTGTILQTFTPSVSTLDAVRLKLRAGGEFPLVGCETTVMIKVGLADGEVLGSSTAFVPGPQAPGATIDVYFWFDKPLLLAPPGTYAIEWVEPPGACKVLSWFVAPKDTYPGGIMGGSCSADSPYYDETHDLIFATYYVGPDADTEGPIASEVLADPNPVPVNGSVTIVAKVDDTMTGGSMISSAAWGVLGGEDDWAPMEPKDGTFDSASEYVVATITVPSTPGPHVVGVWGTDALGNIGRAAFVSIDVYEPPIEGGCIVFEDHFDDFTLGPGWNIHLATDGDIYEKTSEIGSVLVLAADGADIWEDVDQYVSTYRSVDGDFDAIVQVLSQQDVDQWSKAGIGVRNDMSKPGQPGSRGSPGYAGIFVTPGNGYAFQWDAGGCRSSVDALRAHPNYPDQPDGSESLEMLLWWGPWEDCYGQRIRGWIRAPNQKTGGKYLFRIASDDNSELWLSTDENPANVQLIAQVPGWTGRLEPPPVPDPSWQPFQYDKYPEQYSQPVEFKPGKKYYIEVLHKEGGGDDFLAVQWAGPSVSGWKYVKPYGYPSDPAGFFVREWWTTGWGPDGFLDSNVNTGAAGYPCWLKLSKRGTSFSGYYSMSGPNGPWDCVGGATLDDAQSLQDVGIMATSHSSGNVGYNGFEYFALQQEDTKPPEFELKVKPTILWPPNHKMVEIKLSWTIRDAIDPSPTVSVRSVTMNEADETDTYDPAYDVTLGDGRTIGDIRVDADGHVFLRAERSGTGTGRVYTITCDAVDRCGNVTTRSVTVTVPHDRE